MSEVAIIEDDLEETLESHLDLSNTDMANYQPPVLANSDDRYGNPDLHPYVKFEPKFAFEVALRYEPLNIVMHRYDVSLEQMKLLTKHKPFLLAVKQFQREIKEQGITFKMKSKMLAEDLLDTAYLMSKDLTTPASVRMDGIKNIVRWAELEPVKNREDGSGGLPQFNIQINL